MITDQDFKRFMIRRELKEAGANPNAKVSVTSLVELSEIVGETMGKLLDRIKALEKQVVRLDHLEKHALTWRGDWERGISYPPSCVVRRAGGLYVALIETLNQEPGAAGAPWSQI